VFDGRVCVTTYAGSVLCVSRRTGRELWTTYVKRDALRYESFYASPSTDGQRIFTVARSGRVVALDAATGALLWTNRVGGSAYTTPAVASGYVFVGGTDGTFHAFDAVTGTELWSADVGGRILGAPLVIGKYVFFSTKDGRTFGARIIDGKIVWRLPFGRYAPGIATEQTYYFSVNGRLLAVPGREALRRAQ
jgi:outer membrane protein assembly factor BamB